MGKEKRSKIAEAGSGVGCEFGGKTTFFRRPI